MENITGPMSILFGSNKMKYSFILLAWVFHEVCNAGGKYKNNRMDSLSEGKSM